MRIEGPSGIVLRYLEPRDEIDLYEALRDWHHDDRQITLKGVRNMTSRYLADHDRATDDPDAPLTDATDRWDTVVSEDANGIIGFHRHHLIGKVSSYLPHGRRVAFVCSHPRARGQGKWSMVDKLLTRWFFDWVDGDYTEFEIPEDVVTANRLGERWEKTSERVSEKTGRTVHIARMTRDRWEAEAKGAAVDRALAVTCRDVSGQVIAERRRPPPTP